MVSYNEVRPNAYYDSVTLMLFSSNLSNMDGVKEAAVMMGTEHNKSLMINSGVLSPEDAARVSANDLVIGIIADGQETVDAALAVLAEQFENKELSAAGEEQLRAKTMDSAVKKLGEPNFAIVSLPGKYAGVEAMKAMENGMHVLLFSDNVSLEKEIELKDYALEHDLLMMGPDCGTAIINGVALGFANVVRQGSIGVVAAAGTGLQEVTVVIDRLGGGISQALGTGGRDVKEAVGGKMMLQALEALKNDPGTRVIGIISKPPAESVLREIIESLKDTDKPVVACFMGADKSCFDGTGIIPAGNLEEAAAYMVDLEKGKEIGADETGKSGKDMDELVSKTVAALKPGQKYIRGLYSGGTLCYEAMILLKDAVGEVNSNIALDEEYMLKNVEESVGNTLLDMGDDYFTDGMPHPMIDVRLRVERIKKEALDPETAVMLFDCVLGYGCHEDPAGALANAVTEARILAGDRNIVFVASVCGTDNDIQKRSEQEDKLRSAGVIVMPSNAQASRAAARILSAIS